MAKALDTAFIEILPDTRRLEATADKDVRKALKGAEKAAKDTAESISADLDKAFKDAGKSADAALKGVQEDLKKTSKEVAKTPVKIPVEVDDAPLRQFTRDASGRLRDERGKFVSEGAGLGKSLADGLADGFKSALGGVLKGVAPVIAAALSGPIVSTASSLISALVPVAGFLAATLPAAAATAGVAIGTLSLAFSGFGDVIKNLDDPKKFAKALEELSPVAQRVALVLRDVVKPAFDAVKFAVQDTTFAGMDTELKNLTATLAGPLKAGLSGIAAEFNIVFKELGAFLRSEAGVRLLNSILENTKRIIADFTPAITPLAKAFGDLVVAVQPVMQNLSGGLADAAKRFADFISAAAKSGDLTKFFQQGLALLGDLGLIAKNLGTIFGALFDTSSEKGQTFLTNMVELTRTFADFLTSAEGSAAIKGLLDFLQNSLSGVLDVVKPLLPLAGRVLELLGTEFGGVLETLAGVLEPVTKAFTDAFLPIFPDLVAAAKEVAPIMAELGRTVGAELGKALAQLLPLFAELILELLPIAVPVIKLLAEVFTFLSPAIKIVFAPLQLLLIAINGLVDGVKAVIKWLGDIDWKGIGKDIGGAFSKAWTAVKDFFAGVGKFFSELPGKIGEFLSSLPGKFVALLNAAFDAAIKAIGIGIGLVLSFFIEVPPLILDAVLSLPEKLGKFFSELWADIKEGASTAWNAIIEFLFGIPDKALNAISSIKDKVGNFISNTVSFWRTTIVNGFNSIVDFIFSIPSKLDALKDFFFNAGKNLINGFMNGLRNVGNFIGDVAGSIVRSIGSFINRVIDKLNDGIAQVDSYLPGDLPRISRVPLATGGLVTGPTNTLLGEAGDEFVLPLQGSKARRAAEALGISGNDGGITIAKDAIQINFSGALPTQVQARQTGEAAMEGVLRTLARRGVRTQVRTV